MRTRWLATMIAAGCGFSPGGGAAHDGGIPPIDGPENIDAPPGDHDAPLPDGFVGPGRKKRIVFANVAAGPHTDFPVWLDITDADLAGVASANAADLFFTDDNGAPIDHEIQRWDAGAHHLQAWVRVPALANGTAIYLRYGDPDTTHAADAPATFRAGFEAVWHLEDPLTGTTPPVADARNHANGTAVSLDSSYRVDAQLGSGIKFDGGDGEVTFANPIAGAGPHTISLWVTEGATADNDALVVLGDPSCGHSRWFHARYYMQHVAVGFFCPTNDWPDTGYNLVNAGPKLVHWVYDGAGNSTLYANGALVEGPHANTGTIGTTGAMGYIGNAPVGWGGAMGAHATLDEVRIASVVRSADWIATEFANQSDAPHFYSVAPAELAP